MANERLTILKRPRSWIVIRPMTLPGFLSAWLRLVGHVIYHSLDIVAFMLGAAVGVTQVRVPKIYRRRCESVPWK